MRCTITTMADAPSSANSLCRSIGHDWRMTTAPDYRLCQRQGCKAAEHLRQGQWVSATPQPVRHLPGRVPRQILMPWAASGPRTLWNLDQPQYQEGGDAS